MIDVQKIDRAFDDFEAAVRAQAGGPQAPTVGAAAIPDPCGLWQSLRGPWDAIIQALKALGAIIPIARRAAEAMEKVRDLLNVLCP